MREILMSIQAERKRSSLYLSENKRIQNFYMGLFDTINAIFVLKNE